MSKTNNFSNGYRDVSVAGSKTMIVYDYYDFVQIADVASLNLVLSYKMVNSQGN